MNLPLSTSSGGGLLIAAILGTVFGILLHKGGVTNYNVIVNFFRLKDLRVLRVMLTAVVVGGLGVYVMISGGIAEGWHIKPTLLLGVVIGATLFGIGMTVYGYCPGTGVAALATGSVHALVGMFGMLVGGLVYAASYPWIKANILSVGDYGKIRLSDVLPVSDGVLYVIIAVVAVLVLTGLRNVGKTNS
ncbi:MAG: YeeE/YedE family protein [Verrucomicrobiae bacterium]|nr:YeeE/YedE family protein [Verrucomicrobiae bacterium]NNJ85620.1 YeeE/YedE family protein [Akkermansiaceae bacterium]